MEPLILIIIISLAVVSFCLFILALVLLFKKKFPRNGKIYNDSSKEGQTKKKSEDKDNPFKKENDIGRPRDQSSLAILEKNPNDRSCMSDLSFLCVDQDVKKMNRKNFNNVIDDHVQKSIDTQRNLILDKSVENTTNLKNTNYISIFDNKSKENLSRHKDDEDFTFPNTNRNDNYKHLNFDKDQKLHTSTSSGKNPLNNNKNESLEDVKDSARVFLIDEDDVNDDTRYEAKLGRQRTFDTGHRSPTKRSSNQVLLDYGDLDDEKKSKNDLKLSNSNTYLTNPDKFNSKSSNSVQLKFQKLKLDKADEMVCKSEAFDKSIESASTNRYLLKFNFIFFINFFVEILLIKF